MANYTTHRNIGILASVGVTALVASSAYATLVQSVPMAHSFMAALTSNLNIITFVLMSIVGIVGSLFPDVDLNYSVPTRFFKTFVYSVSFIVVMMALVMFKANVIAMFSLQSLNMLQYYGSAFGVACVSGFVVMFAFNNSTIHRGLIHSIPFGIVGALFIYMVFHFIMTQKSINVNVIFQVNEVLVAAMFFIGYLVHLTLDEIYAINGKGFKLVKSSFGTALKFVDRNNILGTLVLYGLIVGFVTYQFAL